MKYSITLLAITCATFLFAQTTKHYCAKRDAFSTNQLKSNSLSLSQIAETERKQEILVKILKEVTSTCPKCKMDVAKRLSQITGVIESVPVEEADVI